MEEGVQGPDINSVGVYPRPHKEPVGRQGVFEHVDLPRPAEGVGVVFLQAVQDRDDVHGVLEVGVGGRQGQVHPGGEALVL